MPSTAALLRLVVVSVGTVRAPDAQKAQADVWRNAEQSGALRAGGGVELVAFAPFNESVQGLQAASASLSESAAEGPRGGRALPLIADDASPCGRPSAACWRAHDNHSADSGHHVGQAFRQKSAGWWCAQQRPLAALNVVKRAYPPRTAENSAGVDYYLVLDDDTYVDVPRFAALLPLLRHMNADVIGIVFYGVGLMGGAGYVLSGKALSCMDMAACAARARGAREWCYWHSDWQVTECVRRSVGGGCGHELRYVNARTLFSQVCRDGDIGQSAALTGPLRVSRLDKDFTRMSTRFGLHIESTGLSHLDHRARSYVGDEPPAPHEPRRSSTWVTCHNVSPQRMLSLSAADIPSGVDSTSRHALHTELLRSLAPKFRQDWCTKAQVGAVQHAATAACVRDIDRLAELHASGGAAAVAAIFEQRLLLKPAGQPALQLFNELIARRVARLPGAPEDVLRRASEMPIFAEMKDLQDSTAVQRNKELCEKRVRRGMFGRYGSSLKWFRNTTLALDDPLVSSVLTRPLCSIDGFVQVVREIEPQATPDACGLASVHAPSSQQAPLLTPTCPV